MQSAASADHRSTHRGAPNRMATARRRIATPALSAVKEVEMSPTRTVGNGPAGSHRPSAVRADRVDLAGPARTAELADVMARLLTLLAPEQTSVARVAEAMPQRVLLTVEEAGERLGIGKTKAYSLVKSGALDSVLIGRLRRVHVDSINEYAARLVAEHATNRAIA